MTVSELPKTTLANTKLPKISLVMPSFNQGAFLEDAILSVLAQDYPNLEFLIYDGGSSDGSKEIIERFGSQIDYWQSQADDGQAAALAAGFDRATGDVFCWLNSDDVLLADSLNTVATLFMSNSGVDFIYGDRLVIDEKGELIGRHQWPWFLTSYHWALGQPMAQECCFWRRELYQKVGGINSELYFIMDYDLFFRMWKVGRFKKVSQLLGSIRIHENAKNALAQDVLTDEMVEAIERFGLKKPTGLLARLLSRLDQLQLRYLDWYYSRA